MSLWSLDISATTTVPPHEKGPWWWSVGTADKPKREGSRIYGGYPQRAASSSAAPKQEVRSKKDAPKKKPAEGKLRTYGGYPHSIRMEIKKLIIEAELEEARKSRKPRRPVPHVPTRGGEGSSRAVSMWERPQGRKNSNTVPATSFYEPVVSCTSKGVLKLRGRRRAASLTTNYGRRSLLV